jgi:hypothetical protein
VEASDCDQCIDEHLCVLFLAVQILQVQQERTKVAWCLRSMCRSLQA